MYQQTARAQHSAKTIYAQKQTAEAQRRQKRTAEARYIAQSFIGYFADADADAQKINKKCLQSFIRKSSIVLSSSLLAFIARSVDTARADT